jgi:hypothetical protein
MFLKITNNALKLFQILYIFQLIAIISSKNDNGLDDTSYHDTLKEALESTNIHQYQKHNIEKRQFDNKQQHQHQQHQLQQPPTYYIIKPQYQQPVPQYQPPQTHNILPQFDQR